MPLYQEGRRRRVWPKGGRVKQRLCFAIADRHNSRPRIGLGRGMIFRHFHKQCGCVLRNVGGVQMTAVTADLDRPDLSSEQDHDRDPSESVLRRR